MNTCPICKTKNRDDLDICSSCGCDMFSEESIEGGKYTDKNGAPILKKRRSFQNKIIKVKSYRKSNGRVVRPHIKIKKDVLFFGWKKTWDDKYSLRFVKGDSQINIDKLTGIAEDGSWKVVIPADEMSGHNIEKKFKNKSDAITFAKRYMSKHKTNRGMYEV